MTWEILGHSHKGWSYSILSSQRVLVGQSSNVSQYLLLFFLLLLSLYFFSFGLVHVSCRIYLFVYLGLI